MRDLGEMGLQRGGWLTGGALGLRMRVWVRDFLLIGIISLIVNNLPTLLSSLFLSILPFCHGEKCRGTLPPIRGALCVERGGQSSHGCAHAPGARKLLLLLQEEKLDRPLA